MSLAQAKTIINSPDSKFKPLHLIKQQYPDRRFHYSLKDFFSFQTDSGTIGDWNDSRNVLVSENFIRPLARIRRSLN